ncbi:MAG TPA: PHB depolymerase family esterase [Terriglobales bacterium]|nr:PHB depolymerase family esterase [Terriglobales bacterium]
MKPGLLKRFALALCLMQIISAAGQGETLRDRIRERREARKAAQQSDSSFPSKGSLATAEKKTIKFDGIDRYYLVQPVHESGSHPVVVLLHGGTQTAEAVWTQTSLPTIGDRDKFIVVAPNAIGKHWNDGRGATIGGGPPSSANDVGFLKQVISDVVANYNGDATAIFMIGASNGGFMTMHFVCETGDLLRAAGNVISTLPADQQQACPAKKPLPWISMNGTADPIVPFQGEAAGTVKNGQAQPALLSADATFAFWADRDHCSGQVQTIKIPHRNSQDQTSAELRTRANCTDGSTSVYYVLQGAGHTWANAHSGTLIQHVVGLSNQDVDAGEAIWNHFRSTLAH